MPPLRTPTSSLLYRERTVIVDIFFKFVWAPRQGAARTLGTLQQRALTGRRQVPRLL